LFEGNIATGEGGAIHSVAGGLYTQVNLTINSCSFRRNSALQGGAVYSGADFTMISNSSFEDNVAAEGADIYGGPMMDIKIQIFGCNFAGSPGFEFSSSGIYCSTGQLEIDESVLHNLAPVKILYSFLQKPFTYSLLTARHLSARNSLL